MVSVLVIAVKLRFPKVISRNLTIWKVESKKPCKSQNEESDDPAAERHHRDRHSHNATLGFIK